MTEGAGQEAGPELDLPTEQVEDLMNALAKALRAHQLYLKNNPVYQKTIDMLKDTFRKVWKLTDEFALDITENELRCEGKAVYSQTNRGESIAWVLFKDGVRQLSFKAGVEDAEVLDFLDIMQKARNLQAEDNDDLLTLLWEKDFQFIQYEIQQLETEGGGYAVATGELTATATGTTVRRGVHQDLGEGEKTGKGSGGGGSGEGGEGGEGGGDDEGGEDGEAGEAGGDGESGEEAARARGLVSARDFDTTLYFLDETEIEFLRKEVADEYAQDIRRNVLAMLYDVLELQPFATVRTELVSILESFLPYLLGASDFGAVAYVLRESRTVMQRARELLPEHKDALEKLPARLSEEGALSQLLQSLDEAAVHTAPEELAQLFTELRPEALPTLFAWLPKLTNARVRDMVESAVERLASANASTVIASLKAPDAESAIAAIRVAARLKLTAAVPGLAQCLVHADVLVRLTTVQALAEIASPASIQAVERGLDDVDREVRIAAVRVVSQHKSRSALPRVTAVVTGKSMREADLTEKMAFFETYGVLVGESGVELLSGILNSGGFLKRKENPETRACAAMALGRIGSEAARAALTKATQEKEPLVRNAVTRALRGDRASAMFRAGELPQ